MANEINEEKEFPLKALAIAGYRSFGAEPQFFENFAKLNVFIGKNNCGKSNILRFIHEILSKIDTRPQTQLPEADKHLFGTPVELTFGLLPGFYKDGHVSDALLKQQFGQGINLELINSIRSIVNLRKNLSLKNNNPWFFFDLGRTLNRSDWNSTFAKINDQEVQRLWNGITGNKGGGRDQHWIPDLLTRLSPRPTSFDCQVVPAIRKITAMGNGTHEFDGEGIVSRLAMIERPAVFEQEKKGKFKKIVQFLRNVTGCENAEIEIPFNRDTILVSIDGKILALESLGSGIHEVIILAAAATLVDNSVICLEEPELHLNPILQKKLIRYLQNNTSNQYFITTHSASLMDAPSAEIYHVQLKGGCSFVERVTSDSHRSEVCEDLGYHPSDLLQANCVIWVEGPSDRIYVNWWVSQIEPELVEGIHYSIMFYGGKLAAHIAGDDINELVKDFISLRRLNRRGVILMDSDKANETAELNETKKRLQSEFDAGPGFAWVTDGREVENYIAPGLIKSAIQTVHPTKTPSARLTEWENVLKVKSQDKKSEQANKVKVANHIVKQGVPDYSRLNLQARIDRLISFIKESNPATTVR